MMSSIHRHFCNYGLKKLFTIYILFERERMSFQTPGPSSSNNNYGVDLGEFVKRVLKYLVEGLIVAIAVYAIPKKSLNMEEIVIIGLTAAATFAVLDVFLPSIGVSAKQGLGFAIGTGLSGGLKVM